MTLEEAVNKHITDHVHIYTDNGVYVGYGYELHFNRNEHDKLFNFGYYDPDYKEWLMNNSIVVKINNANNINNKESN